MNTVEPNIILFPLEAGHISAVGFLGINVYPFLLHYIFSPSGIIYNQPHTRPGLVHAFSILPPVLFPIFFLSPSLPQLSSHKAGFRCHRVNRVFARQRIKRLYMEKSLAQNIVVSLPID